MQGLGPQQRGAANLEAATPLVIAAEIMPLMGAGAIMEEVEAIKVYLQVDMGQEGQEGLEGLEGQGGLEDLEGQEGPREDPLVDHHIDILTVHHHHHHCHLVEATFLEDPVMIETENIK